MYTWRIAEKPLPDFDGKIHVDNHEHIWQWSSNEGSWIHRDSWYLKEVGQVSQELFGTSLGTDILGRTFSVMINEWDSLYTKSFVSIECLYENGNPGSEYRVANLTKAELSAFIATIAPHDVTSYTSIMCIRVYQVIDPTIKISRTGHSNSVYALMRGKHSYNRKAGRQGGNGSTSMPTQVQYGLSEKIVNDRFTDSWGVDTAKKFLGEMLGYPNAPDDTTDPNAPYIFNFARSRENLYHLPKIGSITTLTQRWWYNVPDEHYELQSVPLVASIGSPKFFGIPNDWTTERGIYPMTSLRGNAYLGFSMYGVLVYPLTATSPDGPLLHSFLIRPYGVDIGGLGIRSTYADPTVWDLVSENSFPDTFGVRHRVVRNSWILPGNELVTFRVADAISFGRGTAATSRNSRSNSNRIPKKIQFFLQNITTGVRSESLGAGLQIVRNRNCMPVGVLPAL